jgi:hypothetical protein
MSNCMHLDNIHISRSILKEVWPFGVMNPIVLYLNSSEQEGKDLQRNTNDSAQGTYVELHTWYPYENSERCNPDEGTVSVKVLTLQNFSGIGSRDTFKKYLNKNLHRCSLNVQVKLNPLLCSRLKPFGRRTQAIRMCMRMELKLKC